MGFVLRKIPWSDTGLLVLPQHPALGACMFLGSKVAILPKPCVIQKLEGIKRLE